MKNHPPSVGPNVWGWIDPLGLCKGTKGSTGPGWYCDIPPDPKGEQETVGRWMSEAEHKKMVNSGYVQESRSGTTHVATPAKPEAYIKQAKPGSHYVEFDVPKGNVKPGATEGWGKIVGPNSLEGRLAAKKGNLVPQMPPAENIVHKATKLK